MKRIILGALLAIAFILPSAVFAQVSTSDIICPNGMTLSSNCTQAPTAKYTPGLCPNGMTIVSNCTMAPSGSVGWGQKSISILSPKGGEVFAAGSLIPITFNISNASGIQFVTVDLYQQTISGDNLVNQAIYTQEIKNGINLIQFNPTKASNYSADQLTGKFKIKLELGKEVVSYDTSGYFNILATNQASVRIVDTPTLKLTYDSANKESQLVANFNVSMSAGNQPLYLWTNGFQFNASDGAHSLVNWTAPVDVNNTNGSFIINPGETKNFTLKAYFSPKIMFAGNYSVSLDSITIGSNRSSSIYPSSVNNKTNSVTIVGETSPYISSITSPSSVNNLVTISGVRFALTDSVVIDGAPFFSGKGDFIFGTNSITFTPKSINLAAGSHAVVISDSVTGKSNSVNLTLTDSTYNPKPVSPYISSIDGPTSININQQGTWQIRSNNASQYAVIWADGTFVDVADGSGIPKTFVSSPVFTHTFNKAGSYYVQFFAKNSNGGASQVLTINVTSSLNPTLSTSIQQLGGNSSFIQASIKANPQNPNVNHWSLAITCSTSNLFLSDKNDKNLCGQTIQNIGPYPGSSYQDTLILTAPTTNNSGASATVVLVLTAYDINENILGNDKEGVIVPSISTPTSVPLPTIKVTVDNQDATNQVSVTPGKTFNVNWTSTGADFCTFNYTGETGLNSVRKGTSGSMMMGPFSSGNSASYIITCTNSAGQPIPFEVKVKSGVTMIKPTGIVSSCFGVDTAHPTVKLSWDSLGAPYYYSVRIATTQALANTASCAGGTVRCNDTLTTNSFTTTGTPGATYTWWVHSRYPVGGAMAQATDPWSDAASTGDYPAATVKCPAVSTSANPFTAGAINAFANVGNTVVQPSQNQILAAIPAQSSKIACVALINNLQHQSNDATSNGEVTALQSFLKSKGYLTADPSGIFGLQTYSAVKSFQADNGIDSTGYVGAVTKAKIQAISCN